jgi:amino acid permease
MKNKKPKFKFMAMSKLIGVIAFIFILAITVYAMKEMHDTKVYDSLPQLIISIFGFASIYAGFYLTMAKKEHIEEEKTRREKELMLLQRNQASQEDVEDKKQEIKELRQKMLDVLNESNQSLL